MRDYIDVNDLVDWHLLAYKKLEKQDKSFCDVYNLWVGKWISVLEILQSSINITWKKIPHKIVNRRLGDIWEVYCNPNKAYKELGFQSKVSLEESLVNSWKFYNK